MNSPRMCTPSLWSFGYTRTRPVFLYPRGYAFRLLHLPAVSSIHPRQTGKRSQSLGRKLVEKGHASRVHGMRNGKVYFILFARESL